MKSIKLIIVLFVALLAQNSFAQPPALHVTDEPDIGGWYVAYGNGLTEDQAEQAQVDSQLSLHSSDTEAITVWADSMLRQAVALMAQSAAGLELADKLTQDEQREAGMFGVEAIKRMLENRSVGSEKMLLSSLAFKAGVIERGGRFIPYFALNLRPNKAHALLGHTSPRQSTLRIMRQEQVQQIEEPVVQEEGPVQQEQVVYDDAATKISGIPNELARPKADILPPPSAHVWEYLTSFGAEPEHYATYSYVLTGRNGGAKYIELVNHIQGSTASAKEMAASKILLPEELNIFLIPAINTDAAAHRPDYDVSKSLLAVLSARSKLSFDRPGPYIITMYHPISSLQKGNAVDDMLYVDLTNIHQGAIAEVVSAYKKKVLNKRLNGLDKLYSLRLSLLNLAFMTEDSIGFAKTASASFNPIFSGGRK